MCVFRGKLVDMLPAWENTAHALGGEHLGGKIWIREHACLPACLLRKRPSHVSNPILENWKNDRGCLILCGGGRGCPNDRGEVPVLGKEGEKEGPE